MKYTFCDMIYNNGTSTIDTGIYPDSSTTINITIKNENTGSTGYDAVYVGNSGLKLTKYGGDDEYIKYEYGNGYAGSSRTFPFWAGSTAEFQLSNTGIVETTTANTWEEQITMTEFTATGDTIKVGSADCFASFGKCVIKKGGVVVADLNPCTLGNSVGLYDTVSDTFKTGSGFTAINPYGDFVLGDGDEEITSLNIGNESVKMIYIGNKPYYAPYQQAPLVDDGTVKAIIKTTSDNETVTILDYNGLNTYDTMTVDGTQLQEVVSSYTFPTAGEHTVVLGVNGTYIPRDTFANDWRSKIVALYFGEGITQFDTDVAAYHPHLEEVYFPGSLTITGRAVLLGSTNVKTILGPDAVDGKYWGLNNELWCFADYGSPTAVTIPSPYVAVQSYAFAGISNIKKVTFNSGLTSVVDGTCFEGGITELVFEGTTPPSWGFSNYPTYNGTMYVPNGCTAAYAASDWGYLVTDRGWTIQEM